MASIIDMAISLLVDPSGVKGGLDKATTDITAWTKTVSKIPGVDMFRRYEKEIVGMTTALTLNRGVDKAIDGAKSLLNYAQQQVTMFREQAKEANAYARKLDITSGSLFELQAAGKGVAFEDITRLILRYNLAVGDAKKADLFADLHLDRVAIQGKNATEVLEKLFTAIGRKPRAEALETLKQTLQLKPDQLLAFTPFLEHGFRDRIEQARGFGLIPQQASLDRVAALEREKKVLEMIRRGTMMEIGEKGQEVMQHSDVITASLSKSFWSGALFRRGPIGLVTEAGDAAQKMWEKMLNPQVKSAAENFLKAEEEANAAATKAAKVQPFVQKYGLQKFSEAKGAIRQIEDPDIQRRAFEGEAAALLHLDGPLDRYHQQITDATNAHLFFNSTLEKVQKSREKAVEALGSAFGAGPTASEMTAQRMREIQEASSFLGEDRTARARAATVAGALAAYRSANDRLPGVMEYGSSETASVVNRYKAGLDEQKTTQETIAAALEYQKQTEQSQLEEARKTNQYLANLGLVN